LPRAPLGPIFMTGLPVYLLLGTMLWTEYRRVIKIGPKGALGSHEIRPIHSAPSLGQGIAIFLRHLADVGLNGHLSSKEFGFPENFQRIIKVFEENFHFYRSFKSRTIHKSRQLASLFLLMDSFTNISYVQNQHKTILCPRLGAE